jgi:exodeoxyribonuclease VII large subunit
MSLLMARQALDGQKRLASLAGRPVLKRPLESVYNLQSHVESLGARLAREEDRLADKRSRELARLSSLLESLSPEKTIERGYAIAADLDGKPIVSVEGLKEQDLFDVSFLDGVARARAISSRKVRFSS